MDDSDVQTKVRILFFAKAREITGRKESHITVPRKLSYTDLRDKVIREFDLQVIRDTLIIAVNEAFVSPEAIVELKEKDEIAVIPPLSGG